MFSASSQSLHRRRHDNNNHPSSSLWRLTSSLSSSTSFPESRSSRDTATTTWEESEDDDDDDNQNQNDISSLEDDDDEELDYDEQQQLTMDLQDDDEDDDMDEYDDEMDDTDINMDYFQDNSHTIHPRLRVIPDYEITDLVECIVKAADQRKANDICALYVEEVTSLASVLVFCNGNSRPQNQAIAASIRQDVEQFFQLPLLGNGVPEGSPESGWMVLDFGSVMVHIMTPKSRLYYNIEGQWREKGGKEMDMEHVLVPNTQVPVGDVNSAPGRVMFMQQQGEPSLQPQEQQQQRPATKENDGDDGSEDPFWS